MQCLLCITPSYSMANDASSSSFQQPLQVHCAIFEAWQHLKSQGFITPRTSSMFETGDNIVRCIQCGVRFSATATRQFHHLRSLYVTIAKCLSCEETILPEVEHT